MSERLYMGSNKVANERIHIAMFALHWAIYRDAIGQLNAALTAAHEQNLVSSGDERKAAELVYANLNDLRSSLEEILNKAGNLRTEIIRANGCSGACKEDK